MENYEFYGYYGRPFVFVSGVSTHMMREEVEAPLGACSPLGMAAPLSYKRRRWRPPLLTHLSCSHMPFGWHLLPLASWSTSRASAYEKHCSKFSPPPPLCRSVVGVPEDPLLPLPNWSKGRRSSSDRTCDRVRRRCLFVAPSSRP